MYQPDILSDHEKRELLIIARKALETSVRREVIDQPENHSERLMEVHGVICTLLKNGEVRARAAIGLPYPLLPLWDAVISSVLAASEEGDVRASELHEIKIELAIVTEPKKIDGGKERYLAALTEADGAILKYGIYEAFLPPRAWMKIHSSEQFLEALCLKAGLDKGMWKEHGIEMFKFNAQIFSD